MEKKPARTTSLLTLLLLLAAWEAVEGRVCEFPSSIFKGLCWRDRNCANVCHAEGHGGGHCEGVRRRCICQKPC
ncbi:unnamed protein product [Spirodela intermedia]|uniref:Knottins-like domain-containing protein n=1 Tax=Spirodela intermedia TaxID=51605 RepID=A0A7I8L6I7_SPIIN|nr:unnamed protein product [Spirodela intermedia]